MGKDYFKNVFRIELFGTKHIIGLNSICPHKFKYQWIRIRKDRPTYSIFFDRKIEFLQLLFLGYTYSSKNRIKEFRKSLIKK